MIPVSHASWSVPAPDAAGYPRRWTVADHALEVLEKLVIGGVLKPGDRLTEIALAARLNVSRTPLRQALQSLVSKGWIQRAANGTIRVVDVSEDEIEALYAVRMALEEMVVAQAAGQLLAEHFEHLKDVLAQQDRAARQGNAELVSSCGESFHRYLWRASGNAVGVQFLEEVLQRTTRYRRLSFSEPYRFKEGSRQHWKLVEALEKHEVEKARAMVRAHVMESRDYVLQAFRAWRKTGGKSGVLAEPKTRGRRPRAA